MGRFLPFAWLLPAIMIAGFSGAGTAQAEDARSSDDVSLSTEYIKEVPDANGNVLDDALGKKRRRLASTEPRRPDEVVVPEPATIALVALGLAGLGLGRRRNRK